MAREFRQFDGDSAWLAENYSNTDWIDVLNEQQKQELAIAAVSLPDDESKWLEKSKQDFNLETLGPRLNAINEELETGRGFAVVRGIDLPPADVTYAYRVNWVLAKALGDVIAQNTHGEVIGAVQAVVQAADNGLQTRGYVSNAELRFHCDGGDVASLLCVRQAPEGGVNTLVSMHRIHNIMAHECPAHLETLYRGLQMYMRKEGDLEGTSMPRRPLFYAQQDHLLAYANLRLMELPYESAGIPMPEDERTALDAFEEIAERPENILKIKLQPGDLLLTHNFVCMHKRSSFLDDPDPEKSRLMLRLWYNIEGSRVEAIQPKEMRRGYFSNAPYVIRH